MEWIFLVLVTHLLFGLLCGYLACRAERRTPPWFLAGALLGGLALVGFLLFGNPKPSAGPPEATEKA